jgi:type IV pilus assembly protein PilX
MSANSYISVTKLQHNERGITLVMVLIFIITLSLVSAVAMRGVITGERVVANERDKALAFQAAESAAREGAAIVSNSYDSASTGTKLNSAGVVTIASPGHPLGGNADFWRTTSSLTPITSCTMTSSDTSQRMDWNLAGCFNKATGKYENLAEPKFVIEKMLGVPAADSTPSVPKTDCWYRITSRAVGGSGTADIILQLMFAQTIAGSPTACK